ncbi:efflux RND transporter periplasmic adaptor subunit [Candidatus Uhrbacteria bacterium]|nr:efflux RND transporter periplasmic adaptor subunit [Candidatus Uhrbacteria bacterium]
MRLPASLTRLRLIALFLLIAIGSGYLVYSKKIEASTVPSYRLGTTEKQTLITSVKGTGQVAGLREFVVSPEVSGRITAIHVKVGDKVSAGTPLVDLDRKNALRTMRDASQSMRDAQIALASAQLEFKESQKPVDSLTLIQAENAYAKAKRDLADLQNGPTDYDVKQAEADVANAEFRIRLTDGSMPTTVRDSYDSFVITLQDISHNLDQYLNDADSVLGIDSTITSMRYIKYISLLDTSLKNTATQEYGRAKISILAASNAVKSLNAKNEDPSTIENTRLLVAQALDQSSAMLQHTSDALQASLTASDFSQSELDGLKNKIESDRSSISSKSSALLTGTQAIQKAKDSYESDRLSYQKTLNSLEKIKAGATSSDISTAQERVRETEASLEALRSKPDSIDTALAKNSLEQRQSSLTSAQNKLADAQDALNSYTVLAPFDGTIVALFFGISSDASPGSSVATLMTSQKIVSVPLNEIDAAKVKNGQKATITFDAIDGLSLTGEVILLSQIGTLTQGVVNYTVQIAFDSEDERIKSGMSASVSIITNVRPDVLVVPNAAIKTQNEQSYVETLETKNTSSTTGLIESTIPPSRLPIETGISNDEITEVTSGLKEGEKIIFQTIAPAATTQKTTSPRTTGFPVGGFGGGAMRIR